VRSDKACATSVGILEERLPIGDLVRRKWSRLVPSPSSLAGTTWESCGLSSEAEEDADAGLLKAVR
jgi:hypothetical protein